MHTDMPATSAAPPIDLDPTAPSLVVPTLAHVYEARARLQGQLPRTPLMAHPLLADRLGCDLLVKHENHLPTGAFKVRGGLNLVSALAARSSSPERLSVITASTGNHGQSIALAAQRRGIACTVVVPVGNNPDKNAAMRAFGATVVEEGRDFDEAREVSERLVAATGARYVHSANEPFLIAGVGTYALEMFEEAPDLDVVLVPIGGGSGASGILTVRNGLGSRARVIGVGAANADGVARSWRTGTRVVGERANTFAEGIATRVTFDLTFGILSGRPAAHDGSGEAAASRGLDDFVSLTEEELAHGVRLALETTHNLAEGAGAASIAAAWRLRDQLAGLRVACVMSGGNLNLPTLARIVGPPA